MANWFRKTFTFKNKRRMPLWFAWPLALLGRLLFFTYRVKIEGVSNTKELNVASPAIFACWHNRIIFGVPQIPLSLRRNLSLLISASRDGEYIATLAKLFQFQVLRGSSSRGGVAALLALKREISQDRSPIITVDGPRGPKYCVHSGIIALAAMGKAPIIPLCFNYSHYLEMKSWDRMQIPLPFSKVTVVFGSPLTIENLADQEQAKETVRRELLRITRDRSQSKE